MKQSLLFDTIIAVDTMKPTPEGNIEFVFKEYDQRHEETGRSWSGMITDRALFDCLTAAGTIKPDVYELGTGTRNEPLIVKKRR